MVERCKGSMKHEIRAGDSMQTKHVLRNNTHRNLFCSNVAIKCVLDSGPAAVDNVADGLLQRRLVEVVQCSRLVAKPICGVKLVGGKDHNVVQVAEERICNALHECGCRWLGLQRHLKQLNHFALAAVVDDEKKCPVAQL